MKSENITFSKKIYLFFNLLYELFLGGYSEIADSQFIYQTVFDKSSTN